MVPQPAPLRARFYRNVMADVAILQCASCSRLFHADDLQLLVLDRGCCPFCRAKARTM